MHPSPRHLFLVVTLAVSLAACGSAEPPTQTAAAPAAPATASAPVQPDGGAEAPSAAGYWTAGRLATLEESKAAGVRAAAIAATAASARPATEASASAPTTATAAPTTAAPGATAPTAPTTSPALEPVRIAPAPQPARAAPQPVQAAPQKAQPTSAPTPTSAPLATALPRSGTVVVVDVTVADAVPPGGSATSGCWPVRALEALARDGAGRILAVSGLAHPELRALESDGQVATRWCAWRYEFPDPLPSAAVYTFEVRRTEGGVVTVLGTTTRNARDVGSTALPELSAVR